MSNHEKVISGTLGIITLDLHSDNNANLHLKVQPPERFADSKHPDTELWKASIRMVESAFERLNLDLEELFGGKSTDIQGEYNDESGSPDEGRRPTDSDQSVTDEDRVS
jgi:hypothetical protein